VRSACQPMSVPDVLSAWVRAMVLSSFDSSGLRTCDAARRASAAVAAAQAPIVESRELPAAQPWTTPAQHLRVHEHVVYAASHFTTSRKRPAQLPEYLHAPTDLTQSSEIYTRYTVVFKFNKLL